MLCGVVAEALVSKLLFLRDKRFADRQTRTHRSNKGKEQNIKYIMEDKGDFIIISYYYLSSSFISF